MVSIASTLSYFDNKYVVKQLSLFFISDASYLYGVFLVAQLCLVSRHMSFFTVDRNVGATIEQRQQLLV